METTGTLSSKGQLALPKKLRESDHLAESDLFRLQRLGRGKYLLERLSSPKRPKAALVKSREGFLVFRSPKGPRLSSEHVKKLEADTT
jgi:bifunctional DNA-binding transcriptional regulator/antitoxin component of YhaV-PrlF toxin-antitoxin module